MAKYTRLSHSDIIPLVSHPDGEALELEEDYPSLAHTTAGERGTLPSYLVRISVILVCLNTLVTVLIPYTFSVYTPRPFSNSKLAKLPYPDQHLGLERVVDNIPHYYYYAWPTKIVHLSQKLKNAVYGDGVQVFISVEDSTIIQFPIPSSGVNTCALIWTSPPDLSARKKDLEIKGDVSEIEVWSIVAPHLGAHPERRSLSPVEIDYDTLTWNTRPVRGELLGTLDLTLSPNATTVDFVCPTDADTLVVEFRCLRVNCHVRFKQVQMAPKMGMYSFLFVLCPQSC